MKILSATFVKSAFEPHSFPHDGRAECAFVGRSNVGKSSLLNAVLGRKGLAKVSRTPGKTRAINFFDVNDRFYFVDLPGYGYAHVPEEMRRKWAHVISGYLRGRETLRLVIQLVDARHEPSAKDLEMLDMLMAAHLTTVIVATKVDKLGRAERIRNLDSIRRCFGLDDEALILPFSALTGEGRQPLLDVVESQLTG